MKYLPTKYRIEIERIKSKRKMRGYTYEYGNILNKNNEEEYKYE